MTSETLTEDSNHAKEYAHSNNVERKNDHASDSPKKPHLQKKVFFHRNSMLTDLMELNHLRSVYNISVAVCILLLLNVVLYYVAAPQKFWDDMNIMQWASGKISVFLGLWISLNAASIIIYQGFCFWANCRHYLHTKLVDLVFLLGFISISSLMFIVTSHFTRRHEVAPITGFAIMAEQVRIFMKVYSFVRENAPRVLRYNPIKDGNQSKNLYPSLQHFIYFMFVPALLYRDTYPRTNSVRWSFAFANFLKLAGCIFISYCLVHHFIVVIFQRVCIVPFSLPDLALTFAGCMLVGSCMMFLIFYGILHCWLNAFAEMLRFGDRQFYTDWWNSTSYSQYYRRWNYVVHDWLHAYIYMDLHWLGFPKTVSMLLVFIVSAIVHEYIITFAFGFFFPALAVTYATIGIAVIFVTRGKTTQTWNTFMWFMQFLGWGVLIFLYSGEWYARKNVPEMDTSLPRLLYCKLV